MAVASGDAVAVINLNEAAVAFHHLGARHDAIGGGDDRVAIVRSDINPAVERALTVEWVFTFAEGAGDNAFDRPKVRRLDEAHPVGGGLRMLAGRRSKRDGGGAGQRRVPQRVKLIERRKHLAVRNRTGGDGIEQRVGLEAVEGRNFAGQRTERGDLSFVFGGYFFKLRIARGELVFFRPQAIEAGDLGQHARVRTGDAGDAHHANQGPSHKHVEIMNGNGDLADLAFGVSAYEKDVVTLAQVFCRITRKIGGRWGPLSKSPLRNSNCKTFTSTSGPPSLLPEQPRLVQGCGETGGANFDSPWGLRPDVP